MALTNWAGAIVRKQDITIAKNYLTKDEIDTLNRLVVIFLETAELRVKSRNDITLGFWRDNVDKILEFNEKPLLQGTGAISHKDMEVKVRPIYDRFDRRRKKAEAELADEEDLKEIEQLEKELKKR